MLEKKIRWDSIDCIKGIACIAIVLIHYNFPGDLGIAVKAFCRFGVPVFFITSGFFFLYEGEMNDAKTVNKIRHIFKMALWAGAFYAAFCLFENVVAYSTNWSVKEYVCEKVTADRIVKFFITNDPFVYSHLWFLLALLYCYVFALLFWKNPKILKLGMFSMPILVIMHNVLQEFGGLNIFKTSLAIPGTEGRIYLFNLFVFRALPFFLCGIVLRKGICFVKRIPLNKLGMIIFFFTGGIIAVLERFTFSEDQFFIGNYMMVAVLCIYAIKHPDYNNRVLQYIGKELSLYVYIFHIAVGRIFDMVTKCFGYNETVICKYSRAVIILLCTLIIAFLIKKIKECVCAKKRKAKSVFE